MDDTLWSPISYNIKIFTLWIVLPKYYSVCCRFMRVILHAWEDDACIDIRISVGKYRVTGGQYLKFLSIFKLTVIYGGAASIAKCPSCDKTRLATQQHNYNKNTTSLSPRDNIIKNCKQDNKTCFVRHPNDHPNNHHHHHHHNHHHHHHYPHFWANRNIPTQWDTINNSHHTIPNQTPPGLVFTISRRVPV